MRSSVELALAPDADESGNDLQANPFTGSDLLVVQSPAEHGKAMCIVDIANGLALAVPDIEARAERPGDHMAQNYYIVVPCQNVQVCLVFDVPVEVVSAQPLNLTHLPCSPVFDIVIALITHKRTSLLCKKPLSLANYITTHVANIYYTTF